MLRIIPAAVAAIFMSNAHAWVWQDNQDTANLCDDNVYPTKPKLDNITPLKSNADIAEAWQKQLNACVTPTPAPSPAPVPAPVPVPVPSPAPDTPLDFSKLEKCADEGGGGCWFPSEKFRKFYLVSGDQWETKTTDGWGTSCNLDATYGFPSTDIKENDVKACYVEVSEAPAPTPAPTPTPTPTPAPTPVPTPAPMPPMANMPFVDHSFNMTKDNGSGTMDIRPTNQTTAGVGRNTGEFRIQCQPTFMAQIDPIVNPGTTSMHHHTFFGNTEVTKDSTNETLSTTGNSTCFGGTANRSAYWIPSLIDTLNGGKPIKPTWGLFYYKTGNVNNVITPPVGLRIIAGKATGNPNAPQGSASWDQQEVVRWSCNDRYINNNQPSIPACSGKLSLLIAFPSCWDGRLDSPDHASHMAYSVNGVCPATHRAGQMADITFNVHWENLPNTNGLRLASDNYVGNAGGFSAHADWMNGWNEAVVQTITQKCLREGRDCHANLMGDGNELYRNF